MGICRDLQNKEYGTFKWNNKWICRSDEDENVGQTWHNVASQVAGKRRWSTRQQYRQLHVVVVQLVFTEEFRMGILFVLISRLLIKNSLKLHGGFYSRTVKHIWWLC